MKKLFALLLVAAMCFSLVACGGQAEESKQPESSKTEEQTSTEQTSPKYDNQDLEAAAEEAAKEEAEEEETEVTEDTEVKTTTSEETDTDLVDGMRPEFKGALDSYEEFFDEYCEFMEEYAKKNPTDLKLIAEYAVFMKQYAETMEKMEALDDGEMNDAETKYYIEVTTRISQKLLEVSATID